MKVRDWKEYKKNTLQGFFTVEFKMGLVIKDCTLHEKNGEQWVAFPGMPYTKPDGATTYRNVILFEKRSRMETFKSAVLPLLRKLRGEHAIQGTLFDPGDSL